MKISIDNLTIKQAAKVASKMGWSDFSFSTFQGAAYICEDAQGAGKPQQKKTRLDAFTGNGIDTICF